MLCYNSHCAAAQLEFCFQPFWQLVLSQLRFGEAKLVNGFQWLSVGPESPQVAKVDLFRCEVTVHVIDGLASFNLNRVAIANLAHLTIALKTN
jgi:hypothetical protein